MSVVTENADTRQLICTAEPEDFQDDTAPRPNGPRRAGFSLTLLASNQANRSREAILRVAADDAERHRAVFVAEHPRPAAAPADAQTLKEHALAEKLAKYRGWYTLLLVNGMGMLVIGVVLALCLPPNSPDPRQAMPQDSWLVHTFGDAGPGILARSLSAAAILFGIGITAYASRCLTVRLRHQEYRLRRLLRLGPPQPGRTAARQQRGRRLAPLGRDLDL